MPGYSMTEEIDVFATGGPATAQSVQQQYLDALNQSNQVAPTSVADIQAEAARLSQLFGGNQRRPTLYDMASSLSQGLAAQAASGRPPSVGYGLASGFNLFSEETSKKREAADALNQKLMMMAYEKTEKERERQKEFQKLAAEAGLDFAVAQFEKTGEIEGTGEKVWALNFIRQVAKDPSIKISAPDDYNTALMILQRPTYQQTEQGTIEIPGYDVSKILGPQPTPSTTTPGVVVQNGVTYTPVPGKTVNGKQVYTDPTGVEGTL
tara:strand:- start:126 stop:920 length:795 start_codon:yes stop_codon:yes gene_type:complete